jgi:hypothetical protein
MSYLPHEGVTRSQGWPEYMIGEPQKHQFPVSLEDIRLVQRIDNEDVIVDRMEIHSSFWDKDKNAEIPALRFIPSTNIEIPTKPPVIEDSDSNSNKSDTGTLPYLVNDISFEPVLSRPPFHASVIDELRAKHGKYRIRYPERHFNAWMKKEEEKQVIKDSTKLMRTPIQEYAAKEARIAKEKTPSEVPEDILARIGRVMLENRKFDSDGEKPQKLNVRL